MTDDLNDGGRGRGRPANPDRRISRTLTIRPSEMAALAARNPAGWQARVRELIAADLADGGG